MAVSRGKPLYINAVPTYARLASDAILPARYKFQSLAAINLSGVIMQNRRAGVPRRSLVRATTTFIDASGHYTPNRT